MSQQQQRTEPPAHLTARVSVGGDVEQFPVADRRFVDGFIYLREPNGELHIVSSGTELHLSKRRR